jgi:hypothetical protein
VAGKLKRDRFKCDHALAIFGEQDGRFSLNEMIQRKATLL